MLKKITKASVVLMSVGTLFFLFPPHFFRASAADATFQVNIQEVLSVSVTTPTEWAKGNVGDFLRNKVTLSVTSNNANGFTALMNTADNDSYLYHSSKANTVLQTLSSDNILRSSFTANRWGYSIDDTDENNGTGSNNSHYSKLVGANASPISLISNAQSTGANPITSRDIYFGTKSTLSQASGTYTGTIVFNVISGVLPVDNQDPPQPVIPNSPAVDGSSTPTYDSTNNRTVVTTVTDNQDDTTTKTTTVSEGNVAPQGVTDSTSSNIYDGSMLATGLAVTASVAATSGIIFFILAKRKKDEEEEDEEETV